MAKDRILENKNCPRCWNGILYSTNIVSKRKLVYYQCAYCGRMITRGVFRKLMERMEKIGAIVTSHEKAKLHRKRIRKARKEKKPGFIVGVVRDVKNKKSLGGVYVYVRGIGIEAFTNSYGQYALKPIPPSENITVETSKPGYRRKGRILKRGIKRGEVREIYFGIRTLRVSKTPPPEFPELRPIWASPEAKKAPRPSGIHGFIRDSKGNPLQGAIITIFAGRKEYIVQTDATGHYELLNALPPGYYHLKATADGFTYDRKTVRVDFMFLSAQDFKLFVMPRRSAGG